MKMTNEEIKEILDAFDQGKAIQILGTKNGSDYWLDSIVKYKKELLYNIYRYYKYRVKPEPEKVELYAWISENGSLQFIEANCDWTNYKLTYDIENGEPICESVKLEKL